MAGRTGNEPGYRLGPDLALERFGDKGLVLLADRDRFITINGPAASLLELMMTSFPGRTFTASDLAAQFVRNFHLTPAQTLAKARSLLASWSGEGLLVMDRPDRRSGEAI